LIESCEVVDGEWWETITTGTVLGLPDVAKISLRTVRNRSQDLVRNR
jgi:hypothetical protein